MSERSEKAERFLRILRLIKLLQRERPVFIDDIMDTVNVARRTVFRDLAFLEEIGIVVNHNRLDGYYITKGAGMIVTNRLPKD